MFIFSIKPTEIARRKVPYGQYSTSASATIFIWSPAVTATCADLDYGTDSLTITNIVDWLHARSWVILCSLWRGSKAERESSKERLLRGRIAFGFRGGKVLKVFKDIKVIKDLKDFSLLFYLAVVVGDAFRADLFDDVAQVLFGVFKDFRVVKVVNDLKGFLSYCFIWLS